MTNQELLAGRELTAKAKTKVLTGFNLIANLKGIQLKIEALNVFKIAVRIDEDLTSEEKMSIFSVWSDKQELMNGGN